MQRVSIEESIEQSLFFELHQILPDMINPLSENTIVSLIPKTEFFDSRQRLKPSNIAEFLNSNGFEDLFLGESVSTPQDIEDLLGKDLSNLLGFDIRSYQDTSANIKNFLYLIPTLKSLNTRLKITKTYIKDTFNIPDTLNISEITFIPVIGKLENSYVYLNMIAHKIFPIASLVDGGGPFSLHDLLHLMSFILCPSQIDGYANFTKDAIAFIENSFSDKEQDIKETLYNLIARSLDTESGNFLLRFSEVYKNSDQNEEAYQAYAAKWKHNDENINSHLTLLERYGGITSSAETANQFFPYMQSLLNVLIIQSPNTALVAKERLNLFKSSDYARTHQLDTQNYWTTGANLYIQTRDHLNWMKSLPHDLILKKILSLPQQ